jgi:hypothetical protein
VDLPQPELDTLAAHLARQGIVTRGNRWVLHKDVSAEDVEAVGDALRAA